MSGAEAYHVYYARGASVSASSGTRISATGTTTDVGGLASGKTYAFIVTAVNANGESAASEIMTASPEAAWGPKGGAGVSAGEAIYTSLAIGTGKAPYVAYGDKANSGKATVMKFSGEAWETVGSAGFAEGASYYVSLALDPDDTPYVAYEEYGTSKKATVMYF